MKIVLASLSLGLIVLLSPAQAGALEPPKNDVVLTISGAISEKNEGDTAVFDLAMLEAMPESGFTTTTIWTDDAQAFTGVSLADLLEAVGADGETLRAIALNDYAVSIPVSDAVEGGPIVAYHRNDAPMSVRDKGPLWIVYPYDSDTAYQTEVVYSRSIWQLRSIEVED